MSLKSNAHTAAHSFGENINPGFPAVVLCVVSGFFVFFSLTDPDIFWHLRTGEEMLGQRTFFRTDPFSFTVDSAPWINLHWFFQVTSFLIADIFSFHGLLLFKALLFGISLLLLFKTLPVSNFGVNRSVEWVRASVFMLIAFEVRYLVPMRPGVYTLFFLSLSVFCLEKFIATHKFRYIVILPLTQVLWVNSQGLFLIGIVLWFVYMTRIMISHISSEHKITNRKKALLTVLTIVTIGTIVVNPYGFESVNFAIGLFQRIEPALQNIYTTQIPENIPTLRLIGSQQQHYFLFTILLFALCCFAIALLPWKDKLLYGLLVIPFAVLGLMAMRNIVLFAFAALPLINKLFALTEHRFSATRLWGKISKDVSIVALIIVSLRVITHGAMLFHYYPIDAMSPFCHPVLTAQYLKNHPIEGNLFNADRYGGYLINQLYPQSRVFIDTRLIIRSKEFFVAYLDMVDKPGGFSDSAEKYGISHVSLPMTIVDRYHNLARHLYEDPQWSLVLTDGSEMLFVKDPSAVSNNLDLSSVAVTDTIKNQLRNRWRKHPAIYNESINHLANMLIFIGEEKQASRILAHCKT